VLDESGRELGRHSGIEGFTVGQRRGVRIAGSEPRYVLRVVPGEHAVVVGPASSLLRETFRADGARWIGSVPSERFEASVRIRHRHTPAPAWIAPAGDGFEVELHSPERAVAPGQAAVIYRGDEVVGGGFIV
jgi:tRNA-specific 2-thiouridylase